MTRFPTSLASAAGAAAVLLPGMVWAQPTAGPGSYGWGSHMMGGVGGWSGMIFGPIFIIVVLALAIALAVLLVRWLGGPWRPSAPHQPQPSLHTPLDTLKERFARGEIDKEEFEERRRILGE